MKKFFSLVLLCLMGFTAFAQTSKMEFSYCNDNSKVSLFGTGKKETYDVAILLKSSELVGTTVEGIRVYIPKTDNISDLSVWMSKQLSLDENKVNNPDVCSQTADLSKAFAEEDITFDKPYTITDEGVYVGYSFTVNAYDSASASPLPVCDNTAAGGFYIHTSKKYLGWMDKVEDFGNLAFSVMLSNVSDNSAALSLAKKIYTVRDQQTAVDLTLVNHGAKGVQSMELAYTLNGETRTLPVTLPADKALPGKLGASTMYSLFLPALADDGEYPLSVSLTKVNGETNGYSADPASATLDVRAFIPSRNVLFEEYTGTWCSNCPRGNAAIKILKRVCPEGVIALAYHNKDAMEVMEATSFPTSVRSFPTCTLDRGDLIDPYFGSGMTSSSLPTPFHIYDDVVAASQRYALANLETSAKLSADGRTVSASATATFPRTMKTGAYYVEYVLVANGLHGNGELWNQINGLSGADATMFPEPEFEQFLNAPKTIEGLVFDDVVIATTRLTGDDVDLPKPMNAYTPYTVSATFSLDELAISSKSNVIQDLTKLDVVAILINGFTGEVVNAAQSKVDASDYVAAGVRTAVADGNSPVRVEYTDLSGRSVSQPGHGVFVKTVRYADGTAVSRKTVR